MKQQRRWTLARTASVFMLAALCAHSQDDVNWTGEGADNLWSTDANWDPNPPAAEDSAIFDLDDTYQVDFDDDETTAGLSVMDGVVTFDLAGKIYDAGVMEVGWNSLSDVIAVFTSSAANARLLTDDLSISQRSAPGAYRPDARMIVSGPITWTNSGAYADLGGTYNTYGLLRIENGAQANLQELQSGDTTGDSGLNELMVTGDQTVLTLEGRLRSRRGELIVRVNDQAVLNLNDSLFAVYYFGSRAGKTNWFYIDNATVNHTPNTTSRFDIGTAGENYLLLTNGAKLNSTGYFYFGRLMMMVESGSMFNKTAGRFYMGWHGGDNTLIVRDDTSKFVMTHNLRMNADNSDCTILVETGGLLRIQANIYQQTVSTTAAIAVRGDKARIEADNLYVGLASGGTAAGGRVGTLSVADQGELELTDLLRVGSLSSLALDGGTVAAGNFELMAENSDLARLAVNLNTGGTAAQITAAGGAAIDGAEFELTLAEAFESDPGDEFTIIGAGTLTGRFDGIEDNSVISVGDYYQFRASYENNSFTLTTMPPKGTILMVY